MATAQVVKASGFNLENHVKLHHPFLANHNCKAKMAIALVNNTQATLCSPAVFNESGMPVEDCLPHQIQHDEVLFYSPHMSSGFLIYLISGRDAFLVVMWTPKAWNLRVLEGRPSPSAVLFRDMFNNGAKLGDDPCVRENTGNFRGKPYLVDASMNTHNFLATPSLNITLKWNTCA